LGHHHDEPQQPGRNVQPMAADKCEKGGQKGAALRHRTLSDHGGEFVDFQNEEAGAEHKSDRRAQINAESASRADRQRHQPTGVTRGKQTRRFDCGADLIEQFRAGRSAGSRMHERRVSREHCGKHHDVTEQENPEAVRDDNPL
jgi:hypothetical protein